MVYVSSWRALAWAVGYCIAFPIVLWVILMSTHIWGGRSYAPNAFAGAVAMGTRVPGGDYAPWSDGSPPACRRSRQSANDEMAPRSACLILSNGDLTRCGIYTTDLHCVVIEAHEYLLTQPELLGKAIDGLLRPCHYLPKPDQWASFPAHRAGGLSMYWKDGSCDQFPDRYPGRVILVFHDESNVPVSVWEKQRDVGRLTLFWIFFRQVITEYWAWVS